MKEVTLAGSLWMILWGFICLFSAFNWVIKSWRSSASELNRHFQKYRPRNWEKWPIFGYFWHQQDRHQVFYLWQMRLASILMGVFSLVGLAIGGLSLYRHAAF